MSNVLVDPFLKILGISLKKLKLSPRAYQFYFDLYSTYQVFNRKIFVDRVRCLDFLSCKDTALKAVLIELKNKLLIDTSYETTIINNKKTPNALHIKLNLPPDLIPPNKIFISNLISIEFKGNKAKCVTVRNVREVIYTSLTNEISESEIIQDKHFIYLKDQEYNDTLQDMEPGDILYFVARLESIVDNGKWYLSNGTHLTNTNIININSLESLEEQEITPPPPLLTKSKAQGLVSTFLEN